MRKLPREAKVVWWSRRAIFEVVEEVAEAIFRAWVVASMFYITFPGKEYVDLQGWWLACLFVCLVVTHRGIKEIFEWQNEVFIVTRDDSGGGRIYKFSGWLSEKAPSDKITETSPAVSTDTPWFYRLWGWMTNEKMTRVNLFSQQHIYIQGQRITPDIVRAITSVRGAPPRSGDEPPDFGALRNLEAVRQAYIDGLIDKSFAQTMTRQAIMAGLFRE